MLAGTIGCHEPDLLNVTKALAVSSGRREYSIVRGALRAHMRSDEAGQGRPELRRELPDRVAERPGADR